MADRKDIATVVEKGTIQKVRFMSDVWKKNLEEDRAQRWDRFWDGVWVYGAAVGLLVLVSLSRITV